MFQPVAKTTHYHQLCLGIIPAVKARCLSQALPFLTGFRGDIQLLNSCSTLRATSTQIPLFGILHNRQQRILDISSRPMRYANYPPDFTHPAQYSAIIAHRAAAAIHAQARLSVGTFAPTPACKHTNMQGHVMYTTRSDFAGNLGCARECSCGSVHVAACRCEWRFLNACVSRKAQVTFELSAGMSLKTFSPCSERRCSHKDTTTVAG